MTTSAFAHIWNPIWLRPLAIVASVGLHGTAVVAFVHTPPARDVSAIESLEFSMAPPEGETLVEDEKKTEDSTAQDETVASVKSTEPPPPPEPEAVEPVKVEEPEAETIQAAIKPPEELPPEKKEEPPKEPEIVKQITPETTAQEQTVAAAEESFASRAVGVENGLKKGGGMTRAAYAATVMKQLAKNKKRSTIPAHGVVHLSFMIGPSGRVEHATILKSVNPALDAFARSIVASIQVPPPPGGKFEASVKVEF